MKVERFRLEIGDNIIRSVNPTTPVCNRFANCGGILIPDCFSPERMRVERFGRFTR
jgi:hypothetical protein